MVDQNITEYDLLLEKIMQYNKIAAIPSCQVIYTYLMIYGKMTYQDLNKKLVYSRGTIFSSLKELQHIGFVDKEEDPDASDKRKNTFYYAKRMSINIESDPKFIQYISRLDKLDELRIYSRNVYSQSMAMINSALESFRSNDDRKDIIERSNSGLFYYEIGSIKDTTKLRSLLNSCIEEFENQMEGDSNDYLDPMENPAVFSVVLVGQNNPL